MTFSSLVLAGCLSLISALRYTGSSHGYDDEGPPGRLSDWGREQRFVDIPEPVETTLETPVSILVDICRTQLGIAIELLRQTVHLARFALLCDLRAIVIILKANVRAVVQIFGIWAGFWWRILSYLCRAAFVVGLVVVFRLFKALNGVQTAGEEDGECGDETAEWASDSSCPLEETASLGDRRCCSPSQSSTRETRVARDRSSETAEEPEMNRCYDLYSESKDRDHTWTSETASGASFHDHPISIPEATLKTREPHMILVINPETGLLEALEEESCEEDETTGEELIPNRSVPVPQN